MSLSRNINTFSSIALELQRRSGSALFILYQKGKVLRQILKLLAVHLFCHVQRAHILTDVLEDCGKDISGAANGSCNGGIQRCAFAVSLSFSIFALLV